MRSVVIIPSRLNSLRLPQKPLISISGKTLIQRVYEQIKKFENKIDCIVATDSKKIYNHVKANLYSFSSLTINIPFCAKKGVKISR